MQQKKYKINRGYRLLVNSILFIFNKIFRIRGRVSHEVKNITGPYLLLSNHIGTYDPFILSYYLRHPPHFVSSDAVFKDPLLGFFLKRLGVIPKKKNVRDTQVIRDMKTVTQNGGAIGLFPEGSRSWTGTSLHVEPSIAKLIKLLNVPVITAVMKGMHLTNPRWAFKLRRSSMIIDYKLTLSQDQIQEASIEEIYQKVVQDIAHDEVDFQRKNKFTIRSGYRAEHLGFVLFYCPACKSVGQIRSSKNTFDCKSCGQKHYVDQYGFFEKTHGEGETFDNIRDWFDWQRNSFEKFIQDHYKRKTFVPLFRDDNMEVYQELNEKLEHLGTASISFYINRLLIRYNDGRQIEMPLDQIQTLNPQLRERIELIFKGNNYRITSRTPGISGLKWEFAANAIWQITGQEFKQSSYLIK
jgi:1-acyl-sn-glycerol-3-phosphate acyltransferase